MTSQYCTRVTHVLFFSLHCNAEVLPYPRCLLHAHCLNWYIRVGCLPTFGRFTHVVADEATQGIDPKGLRRLVVGKIPDYPDSIWCRFWQTSSKATRAWKDVCGTPNGVISGFNLWPEGQRVWGPRLTPMWVSPTLPFQHCSLAPTVLMHLVRAAYIPKRKLPYPSACCVHCPNTVSGTRGTREQHQVAVLRDRVLLPLQW